MKKLLGFLLAVVLVFSLGVNSYAVGITFFNVDGYDHMDEGNTDDSPSPLDVANRYQPSGFTFAGYKTSLDDPEMRSGLFVYDVSDYPEGIDLYLFWNQLSPLSEDDQKELIRLEKERKQFDYEEAKALSMCANKMLYLPTENGFRRLYAYVLKGTTKKHIAVSEMSFRDQMNQQMIVSQDFGERGIVIESVVISLSGSLSIDENGTENTLVIGGIGEIKKTSSTKVRAVCYNLVDGAYHLDGTFDEDGNIVFPNFVSRDTTNITIYIEG